MAKIKICGLRRVEDILYVNEYLPDYVGFVFAESKRKVSAEYAAELRKLLNPSIIPVGVFVNENVQTVASLVNNGTIDMVQLHGDESEEYIKELRNRLEKPTKIVKAVRVLSKEQVKRYEEYEADYLLLDTFSKDTYGGTGKCFDWGLIEQVKKPFFLAGGINSENVTEAIKRVKPFAVDVSSAVEIDGYKDREKIRQIILKVRSQKM